MAYTPILGVISSDMMNYIRLRAIWSLYDFSEGSIVTGCCNETHSTLRTRSLYNTDTFLIRRYLMQNKPYVLYRAKMRCINIKSSSRKTTLNTNYYSARNSHPRASKESTKAPQRLANANKEYLSMQYKVRKSKKSTSEYISRKIICRARRSLFKSVEPHECRR